MLGREINQVVSEEVGYVGLETRYWRGVNANGSVLVLMRLDFGSYKEVGSSNSTSSMRETSAIVCIEDGKLPLEHVVQILGGEPMRSLANVGAELLDKATEIWSALTEQVPCGSRDLKHGFMEPSQDSLIVT